VVDVFLHPQHGVTRALLAESGVPSDDALALAGGTSGHVLRLTYQGNRSSGAQLTRLSRESGLDFALLQGSVGRLKGVPYGQFTIEIEPLDDSRFARLLAAASAHAMRCEILR
jgi:D-methionine transport system ATP-binding protein